MELDKFTHQAAQFWAKVPSAFQAKLLSNVYCGKCRGAVKIVGYAGRVEKGDLILQGQCATCGGEVARLVEGA